MEYIKRKGKGMRRIAKLFMGVGVISTLSALVLLAYNCRQDRAAGNASRESLIKIEQLQPHSSNNIGEMDSVKIDGNYYIGYIAIPSLDTELPVISEWSYSQLQIAPCRYYGAIHTDNLVIAAHNYTRHFGKLRRLRPGDKVFFTDVNQICHSYEVEQILTIKPTDTDIVTRGDYPLTFFTCTYSGKMRIAVQCRRLNKEFIS